MSKEEPSGIPSGAKTSSPSLAAGAPAATILNAAAESYDDPPLDQMEPSDGGSFEENEWQGEDPPEEYQVEEDVPEDEYAGADPEEYTEEEMPDDEMTASRSIASSTMQSGVRETLSEDLTYTTEGADRYGVLVEDHDRHGDEETLTTQDSSSSRGAKSSIAKKLKGRYLGRRSPGALVPSSPASTVGVSVDAPSVKSSLEPSFNSRTVGDAPSANSPPNDPSVSSPAPRAAPSAERSPHDPSVSSPASSALFSTKRSPHDPSVGSPNSSELSPGVSENNFVNGGTSIPRGYSDGYHRGRKQEEELISQNGYQSYDGSSLQVDSQFSGFRTEFTDGDEIMSPLASPTTQSFSLSTKEAHSILAQTRKEKEQVITGGPGAGTPYAYRDAGDGYVSSEPSPSVPMSPHSEAGSYTTIGSYTTGSYTTDASSMISAEANPSTRRALILQMAKARMNSGKRREAEENAGFGGRQVSSEDTVEEEGGPVVKPSSSELTESSRPLSPTSDVNFGEEITGDLD